MIARFLGTSVLLVVTAGLVSCASTAMTVAEVNRAEAAAVRHVNDRSLSLQGPFGQNFLGDPGEQRAVIARRVHPNDRERVTALFGQGAVAFFVTEATLRAGLGTVGGKALETGTAGVGGDGETKLLRLVMVKGDTVVGDFTLP